MDKLNLDEIVNNLPDLGSNNKEEVVSKYKAYKGIAPELELAVNAPDICGGQLWTLVDAAGLPNILVYVEDVNGGNGDVITVYGVSDRIQFASDKDFVFNRSSSPCGFSFMIEAWNPVVLSKELLNSCVTDEFGETKDAISLMCAGKRLSEKSTPIRWPGDTRIDFQKSEKDKYIRAKRMTRMNTQQFDTALTVEFPFTVAERVEAPHGKKLQKLAADSVSTSSRVINYYNPIEMKPGLTVALAVWSDDSFGIAVDTAEAGVTVEFVTSNDEQIPIEAITVFNNVRIWHIVNTQDISKRGIECNIRTPNGLVTVSFKFSTDTTAPSELSDFNAAAKEFESAGTSLDAMLLEITRCQDTVLRLFMEEALKSAVRLGKDHPSWLSVKNTIFSKGTDSLKEWILSIEPE